MCDTVVATGEATAGGGVIFAKNSDREPGEAQAVELHAARSNGPGERVRATYLALPAARRSEATLLCRPHWMWGAEMGANSHGVVIGNEAVFTRVPREPLALLGMDLLRLALERSTSAVGALETLTELLETHGQGGPAGHRDPRFSYDSSFIIADPEDAWVVETANRAWVAKRVRGVRAISNGLTVRDDWDRAASGLRARARDWKLEVNSGRLDFKRTFETAWLARAAAADERRACAESYLLRRRGAIGVRDAMAALRQHGTRPGRGLRMSVCSHASFWPTRRAGQTTGSLVSELGASSVHWVTASAAPCTSLFKPLWLDAAAELGPTPRDRFDPRAHWWRHERLHRRALADLPAFLERFEPERDAFEAESATRVDALAGAAAGARRALSREIWQSAVELEERVLAELGERPLARPFERRFWRAIDRRAGLVL